MAKVMIYEHSDFGGDKEILYGSDSNLDEWGWWDLNDEVSSFIIQSGYAQFFSSSNYGGLASQVFGPGAYDWVEAVGIVNDSISSVQVWG